MNGNHGKPTKRFTLSESVEIDEAVERVFEQWRRYEELPKVMESVQRAKRIDDEHILWDVDIAGRQFVWEGRIVESIPNKRIRWVSSWGAPNSGEVRFEALSATRTRVTVDLAYRPKGLLEHLGAMLSAADFHVRRDLDRLKKFLERPPSSVQKDARSFR